MKITIFIISITLLFVGFVDKTYIYRSTISDVNLSAYLSSTIKQKESLYQITITLNSTYFFSISEAKEQLSKEILRTVKTLCKEKNRRYFAIVTPKELSNYPNGSLVTTEKEFIEKLQRRSFEKNEQKNHASLCINILLLKERPLNYLVWDTQNY